MYKITTRSKKAEKQFYKFLDKKISKKLEMIKIDPRRKLGAHMLKGKLLGKWSCWLGANIRMVYEINEEMKEIVVVTVGSHKIY